MQFNEKAYLGGLQKSNAFLINFKSILQPSNQDLNMIQIDTIAQGGATRLVKRHMFPQKIRKLGHLLRGITMILVSNFTSS